MPGITLITPKLVPRNVFNLVKHMVRNPEVKWATRREFSAISTKLNDERSLAINHVGKSHYLTNSHVRSICTTNALWTTETITVPPFADSVSEGDVKFTCKVGDQFNCDDVVMEIETDKTTVSVPAPFSGVLLKILVNDGDTVKAGQALFTLEPATVTSAAAKTPTTFSPPIESPAPPTPTTVTVQTVPPKAASSAPPTSPDNTNLPPPTPPKPVAAAKQIPVAAISSSTYNTQQLQVKVPPADYSREITGTRTEQRVKMSRMRLKIAQRLKEAQNTNASLTTFNEIDMSSAINFRKTYLETFQKKYGTKLGYMSIFTKAAACALLDQPVVNAVIDKEDIVFRDFVDISVAVSTPKGLVVPVIRNVENKNYADIEIELAAIAEKSRKGAITTEDMEGGNFTISNGGVFGNVFGTPLINPPQSAILGMHGIFERPVAINGQVEVRPMMYIALTYDHRLIDGREATTFLRKVKSAVEDPTIILAGI